jgi:hypothetical protein
MIVNNDLEQIWKEAVLTHFETICLDGQREIVKTPVIITDDPAEI